LGSFTEEYFSYTFYIYFDIILIPNPHSLMF